MGMRGLNPQNPHDRDRERREEEKRDLSHEKERRANEKVQEILRDQEGDMSAYTGGISDQGQSDCDRICHAPVGKIMSSKVAALSFDDTLLTVQGIFASVKFRHLPVVDSNQEVIGIISDRDLLRVASPFFGTINEQTRDKEIMNRKVGTIMTRKPVCANVDNTIIEAVSLMNQRKISCLPIVKKGTMLLLGIITWKDVVRAFCPRSFSSSSESTRLKAGVGINPENSESARLRAKAKQSTRRLESPPRSEASASEKGPVVRDKDARQSGPHLPPPPTAKRTGGSDTGFINRAGSPQIAATEKLRGGYTAGQAGSDLAARQRALMREQLENAKEKQRDIDEAAKEGDAKP